MGKSASEVVAKRLYEAGCRHAFGIPGGEVLAMMDALDRAGLKVALVKHENSGGFMAEGTWHATGAPGVLFATIGPGIANAANVIAYAWQDRVPMIVLTGCVPALEAHTYSHQVFDHIKFLEPITKAAELATIRDHKLGLPIIVFVDEELGLIELKQRGSQMPNLWVEFPGADFTAVGRAIGGAGETSRSRE